MTAVTLVPARPVFFRGWEVWWLQHCGVVLQLWWFRAVTPPRVGGVVGWEPHSGRKQSLYVSVWCKLLAY